MSKEGEAQKLRVFSIRPSPATLQLLQLRVAAQRKVGHSAHDIDEVEAAVRAQCASGAFELRCPVRLALTIKVRRLPSYPPARSI